MKEETKVVIASVCLCFLFIICFSYVSSVSQKVYYVYQVGIYKDESNRDKKLNDLSSKGFDGVYYEKDNQFYVLSLITDDKKEIEEHASELKGIIKEYKVSGHLSKKELLKTLEGDNND